MRSIRPQTRGACKLLERSLPEIEVLRPVQFRPQIPTSALMRDDDRQSHPGLARETAAGDPARRRNRT